MALNCPRCKGISLEEIEIVQVLVDRCVRCAGLWFDNDEIVELMGERGHLRAFETSIPDAAATDDSAACPRCRTVFLRRLEVESNRGNVLRCASCAGTWMDRGQLRETEDAGILGALKSYFK